MAKKLIYTLLSAVAWFSTANAHSFYHLKLINSDLPAISNCNLSPPDSIRVTSIGSDYYALAWNSTGGIGTEISVFAENNNNWDSLYTVSVYGANYYTLNNLNTTKSHLLKFRSICENNQESNQVAAFYPPFGLVLELVLNGRTPQKKNEVQICTELLFPTANDSWIGFQVTNTNNNLSTFFEYRPVSEGSNVVGRIYRVTNPNNIYVANETGQYPTVGFPSFKTQNLEFRIGEVDLNGFNLSGQISVGISDNSVNMCPISLVPGWIFQPYFAKTNEPLGNFKNNREGTVGSTSESLKATTLFSDYLKLNIPESWTLDNPRTINLALIKLTGEIVFFERIEVRSNTMMIPSSHIPSGPYILHIESPSTYESIKVIKLN